MQTRNKVLSATTPLCCLVGALSISLGACGIVKVQAPGGLADPTAAAKSAPAASTTTSGNTTPTSTASTSAATPAASSATPATPEKSKGESDAEHLFLAELNKQGEIERTGSVSIRDAVDGFSPEAMRASIKGYFKGDEVPSPAFLARADEAKSKQLAAAAAYAAKGQPAKRGAPDAPGEAAMRASFTKFHEGADVKAVFFSEGDWKLNYNGLVVRNRYKNGIVLIGVKGADFCVAVPANAAQDSTGNGTFSATYKHDVFDKGRAVPCK